MNVEAKLLQFHVHWDTHTGWFAEESGLSILMSALPNGLLSLRRT